MSFYECPDFNPNEIMCINDVLYRWKSFMSYKMDYFYNGIEDLGKTTNY